MARTETTEGQALWQPGGAEEDSHFPEGNGHLRPAHDEKKKKKKKNANVLVEFILFSKQP